LAQALEGKSALTPCTRSFCLLERRDLLLE